MAAIKVGIRNTENHKSLAQKFKGAATLKVATYKVKSLFKKLKKVARKLRITSKAGTYEIKSHEGSMKEKFGDVARAFGEAATISKHQVPKEQQISIDLGNKKFYRITDKILYWAQDTLKNIFPRFGFFAEFNKEKERRIIGTNVKVKHFTPEEQAEHALYVGKEEDGELRLYDVIGKLYDTTGKISKGQKNSVAYAMTLDGRLVVHEHLDVGRCGDYAYRHSTLGGGKAILCSGLIRIKDGKITHIDNNSGHYKPTAANLYNAIQRLNGVFSKDAKVTCLTYWRRLKKEMSLTRKLPAKKLSVEKFLDKLKKVGKSGLTKHEEYFAKVKRSNERNRICISYKPFPIVNYNNPQAIKVAIEQSIRKVIGANYGHKPEFSLKHYKNKVVGVSVTFHNEEDRSKFIEVLKLKKLSNYISYTQENMITLKNTYAVIMSVNKANKLIKDTLKLDVRIIRDKKVASILSSAEVSENSHQELLHQKI
ncbi:MAG: hypothetical protein QWI36_04005 [Wolbachia endosymbiont of Tyrophagus putrescentiae]|nr:hypothetical protein [Wolbachia endosymbiont of Tyrophagus putrescentiae]